MMVCQIFGSTETAFQKTLTGSLAREVLNKQVVRGKISTNGVRMPVHCRNVTGQVTISFWHCSVSTEWLILCVGWEDLLNWIVHNYFGHLSTVSLALQNVLIIPAPPLFLQIALLSLSGHSKWPVMHFLGSEVQNEGEKFGWWARVFEICIHGKHTHSLIRSLFIIMTATSFLVSFWWTLKW